MSKKKEKQNTTHDRNSALTTYIRIGIIALAILLQLGIMMFTTYFLRANAAPLYVALDILAMVTVFSLINRHDSSAYRLALDRGGADDADRRHGALLAVGPGGL